MEVPLNRPEVSAVIAEFLTGRFSRQELDYGWADTYDINLFRIRITTYTRLTQANRHRPGTVDVVILATRPGGGEVSIWWQGGRGLDGLREALERLQKVLLGMAAAFLVLCKDPEDLPIPSMGPRQPDLTDLEAGLLPFDHDDG